MKNFNYKPILNSLVLSSSIFLTMPAVASDIQIGFRMEVVGWEDDDTSEKQQNCLMGVPVSINLDIDNRSKFGGGPFDIPSIEVSFDSREYLGWAASLFADEKKFAGLQNIGGFKVGGFTALELSGFPIKRGLFEINYQVKSNIFDPNPSNNQGMHICRVTGPEVKVNGNTNNQTIPFGMPITLRVSNDMKKTFAGAEQILEYWLVFLLDGTVYSWGFDGITEGLKPVGEFPIVHFEDKIIVSDLMLPAGEIKVGFCLEEKLDGELNLDEASCDVLTLKIEPKF